VKNHWEERGFKKWSEEHPGWPTRLSVPLGKPKLPTSGPTPQNPFRKTISVAELWGGAGGVQGESHGG